jgi:hypothetical protein
MKKYFLFLLLILFGISTVQSQDKPTQTSITIYYDNLGVVNEIRPVTLEKGVSLIKITDVPSQIDPTSVHIKLNGTVFEQNYQYDLVSMSALLKRYIDNDITVADEKSAFTGKLLSVESNNIVLQTKDGLKIFPNINSLQISVGSLPSGLLTKPTLVWKVSTESAGKQNAEISYMTSGISWSAEYVAVLNDKEDEMSFNSWVSIDNNTGATFENTSLKLIAGEVNRVQEYEKSYGATVDITMRASSDAPSFQEESFFDYHIYELSQKTTLANNENKQLSLFNVDKIKVTKKYILSNNWKNNTGGKVASVIKFLNSKQNNMGMPLPKGKVRVFKERNKSSEFIGEDMIQHTPKDEELTLKLGNAFDIIADETLTDSKQITHSVNEYSYEIKLKNRKEQDVEIEVIRSVGQNWEILDSSIKWEKVDASTIKFIVPVKKNSETTLKYRIRNSW